MGGDITLDSAADVGSVFCLTLTVPIVAATATHLRPFLGRHILLVSNAQIEPPVLMRRLFDLGASVELTRTIEAAPRSRLGTGECRHDLFDQGKGLDAAQLCNEAGGLPMPMAVMIAPADRHDLERLRAAGTDAISSNQCGLHRL